MPSLIEQIANVVATTATTSDAGTTGVSYKDPTNSCGCFNDGECVVAFNGFRQCICDDGLLGERCGDVDIGLSYGKNPNEENQFPITSVIVYLAVAVASLAVVSLFAWRIYKKVNEKQWMKWQETREQTKASIEGPSTPTQPCNDSSKSSECSLNIQGIDNSAFVEHPVYEEERKNETNPKCPSNPPALKQVTIPTMSLE